MIKERPENLAQFLELYQIERQRVYAMGRASACRYKDIVEQRTKNRDLLDEAKKGIRKARLEYMKRKNKEYEVKEGVKRDQERAKRRLKDERVQFWPRKVYRVVVSLETHTYTPASSRRGSVDTIGKTLAEEESSPSGCDISLSLSYITSASCWAPRYDLGLNTTKNTGLIGYHAEYCNTTSETWSDAKIILSTSQTAFQGLGDIIPTVVPWHIKLTKKVDGTDSTSRVLYSDYELTHKRRSANKGTNRVRAYSLSFPKQRHILASLYAENLANCPTVTYLCKKLTLESSTAN